MTKKEIGMQSFLSLKGLARLALLFVGCLLLFILIIFYLMGDKLQEGIAKLPDDHAKINSVEVHSTSFTEQRDTNGFLMRKLMLISVYQVKSGEKSVDVLVDIASAPDFESEARSGKLKLQFVEGRRIGHYPDMASVKARMVTGLKSPWRGRLFGLLVFITRIVSL